MLRDKNLVPLSHQHQHALALCVRLDRALQAGPVDVDAWQAEIQQHFEREIGVHFAAEEKALFPAAAQIHEVSALVQDLLAEHVVLRALFSRAAARALGPDELQEFVQKLSAHIRKEERQLFESLQQQMSPQDLAAVGTKLERALADAAKGCILPNASTRVPKPAS